MTINSNILPNRIISNADLAELQSIRDFVQKKASEYGFDEEASYKISLAVDESCSNIIRHAYKLDSNKELSVEIDVSNGSFTVNIFDWGEPFNPMNKEMQDMEEYLKQFKRGGFGIHIIRMIMDAVEYYPSNSANKPNLLSLKKKLIKI